MNTPSPEMPAARSPPGLKVWFGILGGPVAFALMQGLGWLVSASTCPGGDPRGYGGVAVLSNGKTILYAVFAVMLLVSIGAFLAGVSEWRRTREPGITSIQGLLRPDFLAAAAMLVSAVFALGVLWMFIGLVWLPTCEVVR